MAETQRLRPEIAVSARASWTHVYEVVWRERPARIPTLPKRLNTGPKKDNAAKGLSAASFVNRGAGCVCNWLGNSAGATLFAIGNGVGNERLVRGETPRLQTVSGYEVRAMAGELRKFWWERSLDVGGGGVRS